MFTLKKPIAATIVPLVISAAPAFSDGHGSGSCEAEFETVSEAWAEAKKNLSDPEEVAVQTEDGQEEIAADDAAPTENWFGKPPEVDTVDGYMAEAERAMEAGDTEACMEQLKNAQAAIDPAEKETTTN